MASGKQPGKGGYKRIPQRPQSLELDDEGDSETNGTRGQRRFTASSSENASGYISVLSSLEPSRNARSKSISVARASLENARVHSLLPTTDAENFQTRPRSLSTASRKVQMFAEEQESAFRQCHFVHCTPEQVTERTISDDRDLLRALRRVPRTQLRPGGLAEHGADAGAYYIRPRYTSCAAVAASHSTVMVGNIGSTA
eukprot:m.385440 g.385440  ORF g.385440 m.385440 type:complete len:199 (-) comp21009_c0_seq3:2370-2966(-)